MSSQYWLRFHEKTRRILPSKPSLSSTANTGRHRRTCLLACLLARFLISNNRQATDGRSTPGSVGHRSCGIYCVTAWLHSSDVNERNARHSMQADGQFIAHCIMPRRCDTGIARMRPVPFPCNRLPRVIMGNHLNMQLLHSLSPTRRYVLPFCHFPACRFQPTVLA